MQNKGCYSSWWHSITVCTSPLVQAFLCMWRGVSLQLLIALLLHCPVLSGPKYIVQSKEGLLPGVRSYPLQWTGSSRIYKEFNPGILLFLSHMWHHSNTSCTNFTNKGRSWHLILVSSFHSLLCSSCSSAFLDLFQAAVLDLWLLSFPSDINLPSNMLCQETRVLVL